STPAATTSSIRTGNRSTGPRTRSSTAWSGPASASLPAPAARWTARLRAWRPPRQRSEAMHYDVAIIGYGPSGETAALLLGQLGVRTIVLERDLEAYAHARAVAVDDEVLRIWQRAGIAERLEQDMTLDVHARWKTPSGRVTFETHPTESD